MGKYEVDALRKIYLLNCFYSNDFYVKKICTNLSSRMFKIVFSFSPSLRFSQNTIKVIRHTILFVIRQYKTMVKVMKAGIIAREKKKKKMVKVILKVRSIQNHYFFFEFF